MIDDLFRILMHRKTIRNLEGFLRILNCTVYGDFLGFLVEIVPGVVSFQS